MLTHSHSDKRLILTVFIVLELFSVSPGVLYDEESTHWAFKYNPI